MKCKYCGRNMDSDDAFHDCDKSPCRFCIPEGL